MIKTKAIAICLILLFILSFSGLAFAESLSIYSDLPANHWAYGAVAKLTKAGIVQGDRDKFSGDKVITRYEMAQIVANAITKIDKADAESKSLIEKLATEFASELQIIDVRLTKLESKSSSFKISGDLRLRFRSDSQPSSTNLSTIVQNKYDYRARINFDDEEFIPNLSYHLRATETNSSNSQGNNVSIPTTTTSALFFDRAEVDWKTDKLTTQVGRLSLGLGKNIILWSGDSAVDGINFNYKPDSYWTATAGLVDIGTQLSENTIGTAVNTCNTEFYSVQYKGKDGLFNSSLAYLDVLDSARVTVGTAPYLFNYRFKEYDWTTEIPSGDFLLHYEAVRNIAGDLPSNAEKSGYVVRLRYLNTDLKNPGSTAFFAEYLSMGNWATDSTYAFNDYNGCAGNGIGRDGAKGYGIGVSTVIARDINFSIWGYKLKPYDTTRTGATFIRYAPSLQTSVNFHF